MHAAPSPYKASRLAQWGAHTMKFYLGEFHLQAHVKSHLFESERDSGRFSTSMSIRIYTKEPNLILCGIPITKAIYLVSIQ
ncbi:hypothetical protein AZE42_10373 [Rhizopogon vesiculosus]|uniref:Uncharacterized protein n=1 Tax=Rhizopogon vesiculosus TaxID=180088 RepID=A0A1J8QXT6_9AGAM|nr:hypothetical protein AZE42_10373 [Rhizopogon vesiculosus]